MEIILVFIGTVLGVFGDDINKALMKKIKKRNFLIRFSAFVALCTAGYGFITLFVGKFLFKYMRQMENIWLVLSIVGLFLMIGLIAEGKNRI